MVGSVQGAPPPLPVQQRSITTQIRRSNCRSGPTFGQSLEGIYAQQEILNLLQAFVRSKLHRGLNQLRLDKKANTIQLVCEFDALFGRLSCVFIALLMYILD